MIARVGKSYSIPETRRLFATARAMHEKRMAVIWNRGFVIGLLVGWASAVLVAIIAWVLRT